MCLHLEIEPQQKGMNEMYSLLDILYVFFMLSSQVTVTVLWQLLLHCFLCNRKCALCIFGSLKVESRIKLFCYSLAWVYPFGHSIKYRAVCACKFCLSIRPVSTSHSTLAEQEQQIARNNLKPNRNDKIWWLLLCDYVVAAAVTILEGLAMLSVCHWIRIRRFFFGFVSFSPPFNLLNCQNNFSIFFF